MESKVLSKTKKEKLRKNFIISIVEYLKDDNVKAKNKSKIEYMGDLIEQGRFSIKETKSGEKYYVFE